MLWHNCYGTFLRTSGPSLEPKCSSIKIRFWFSMRHASINAERSNRRYTQVNDQRIRKCLVCIIDQTLDWAATSEFVSSSIPSWHILTAHAQPFSGARDLVFCLKVPLDSLLVWASSEGSGETARMRRLAWTFAARIGDKYQIRLARPRLNGNYIELEQLIKAKIRHLKQIITFLAPTKAKMIF